MYFIWYENKTVDHPAVTPSQFFQRCNCSCTTLYTQASDLQSSFEFSRFDRGFPSFPFCHHQPKNVFEQLIWVALPPCNVVWCMIPKPYSILLLSRFVKNVELREEEEVVFISATTVTRVRSSREWVCVLEVSSCFGLRYAKECFKKSAFDNKIQSIN